MMFVVTDTQMDGTPRVDELPSTAAVASGIVCISSVQSPNTGCLLRKEPRYPSLTSEPSSKIIVPQGEVSSQWISLEDQGTSSCWW